MGMYTEFHFNAELRRDTPEEVIAVLQYMLGRIEEKPTLPEHELFRTDRWKYMLRCDSYYFSADTYSTLRFDETSDAYYLCIRCNFKNYDNEIQKFVSWISPYLNEQKGDFLGFYRYEEEQNPVLLFNGGND